MRDSGDRTPKFLSDAFATAFDTDIWSECAGGTGAVSVVTGKLKLNVPADGDVAGLVTKLPYYVRNARISVDVDMSNESSRAGIVIAKTKVTATNPELENDIVSICLDNINDKVLVSTDVGGVAKTVYNQNWTDAHGYVKLDIEPDGFMTFYEDTTAKGTMSIPLTATVTKDIFELYIYIYAVGVVGTVGYALLDNFQVDLDPTPTTDVTGSGVKKATLRNTTPVYGRLIDETGTADLFETDHAVTDTPTQRIVLSRDCKRFELTGLHHYMDVTNAVTGNLLLYEEAQANDVLSQMHLCYDSSSGLADGAHYIASTNGHLASGAAVQANDTPLPQTFNLERPGQVWFNQDWSGAPGDTLGYIVLIGREVE